MSSVFISYARDDNRSAQRLNEDLGLVGNLEPWLDVHNLPAHRGTHRNVVVGIRELLSPGPNPFLI